MTGGYTAAAMAGERTTEILTRLHGAGDALGIAAVGDLARAAEILGDDVGAYARVSLTDQMRLAILCQWPAEPEIDAAVRAMHTEIGDPIQTRTLPALLDRPAKVRFVELETTDRGATPLTVTIHLVGERALADDVAMLSSHATVPPSTGHDVAALGELVGRSSSDLFVDRAEPKAANQWAFRFRRGNDDAAELAETVGLVLALMERLGVLPEQRLLFERLHPELAGYETTLVSISSALAGVLPRVTVQYPDVSWELVVPTMVELYGDAWGERLGALAGAFDADESSAFELTFCDEPPVCARVSVDSMGR